MTGQASPDYWNTAVIIYTDTDLFVKIGFFIGVVAKRTINALYLEKQRNWQLLILTQPKIGPRSRKKGQ